MDFSSFFFGKTSSLDATSTKGRPGFEATKRQQRHVFIREIRRMCIYYTYIYIYIIFVYFVYTLNNMPVYNQYIKEWIFFRPEYYFSSVFPQPKLFSVGPTYTTCGILWPLLWWGKYTLGASLIIRATKLRGWIVFPETFQPVIVSPVFIGEKKMPQFWKRIVFQPPIFQGQKRYVFRECRGWIIAQHLILLLWNL